MSENLRNYVKYMYHINQLNELHPDKTNKMACAPSEDSDQPQSLRCPLEESLAP